METNFQQYVTETYVKVRYIDRNFTPSNSIQKYRNMLLLELRMLERLETMYYLVEFEQFTDLRF